MRALLPVVFLTAACTFNGGPPDDAEFVCDQDSDCPEGRACQRTRQRCVPIIALDLTAPTLVDGSASVRIRAGVNNPLSDPTAMTFGSTIDVAFALSEPVTTITLVERCALTCVGPAPVGAGYLVSCTLDPGATVSDGACALQLEFADRESNQGRGTLPAFAIDVTPPMAPNTATPGQIVFRRAPWGTDGEAPNESVTAQDGSVTDGVRVVLRSNGLDRAVTTVSPTGAFQQMLVPFGSADLQVAAVDRAGNTSAFVRVLDGEWVATLNQKVAGDSVLNPHRLDAFSVAADTIARRDALEFGASDGLGGADGAGPRVTGGMRWRRADFSPGALYPGGRSVFDPARGKIVNFGGLRAIPIPLGPTLVSVNESTHQWGGAGWKIAPLVDPEGDGQPAGRNAHVMVYDPKHRVVLLHGGSPPDIVITGAASDTWAWNGESWRRLADGPPLTGAVAFWSTRLSKMVVAGGYAGSQGPPRTETWTFDGQRWEQLDAGFPSRTNPKATYSPVEGAGLMFGGGNDLWRFESDHWEFVDAGSGPPMPVLGSMVWNAERNAPWLVSARTIWEWNGSSWAFVDGGPPGDTFEYDARHRELIASSTFADGVPTTTWVMRSGGVVERLDGGLEVPDSAPGVACSEVVAACLRVVNGRVYELKPNGWQLRPGFSSLPAARTALEWQTANDRALAVLSFTDGGVQAWELSPDGSVARVADPPLVAPGAFGLMTPTLTPWQGGLLLTQFDGSNALWNGVNWVPQATFPTQGAQSTVAALADGGLCVSMAPFFGDLAAYNFGSNLAVGVPTTPPLSAAAGAMMFDPERGLTFHFGGRSVTSTAAFLAQGATARWTPVTIGVPEGADTPEARFGGTLKWDPNARRGVLVGGLRDFSANSSLSDTWLLEAGSERPGAVFRVVTSALGVPRAQFTSVKVDTVTGAASAFPDGGVGGGTRSALWAAGRFDVAARENPSGTLTQPALVSLEVTDPLQLRALLDGQPELLVGMTPLGTNGRSNAQLTVDYVELTIRYRLE